MTLAERNWAGNYQYGAARLHRPESVEQLREIVRRADRLKVLGSRHSFNGIADTGGDLVSLERLDRVIAVDRERRQVTVDGGIRYGQLCGELDREGYALPNLASLPHISVAGACATATHGSGDGNGNLSTAIAALELVTADGELVTLSRERDAEELRGAAVALGGFGVVTRVTLDVLSAFDMRQDVYEHLPLGQLEAHFDEITSSAYSVSLFTDWREPSFTQLWLKRRVDADVAAKAAPEPELFGATRAPAPRHPIAGLPPENCTEQLGARGPWYQRLPHFRMDFTPSSGEELQSDYLVPRPHALAALREIDGLRGRVAPLLQVSEVRTVAADDLWMSPCYRQACVSIHFTWKPDWPAVQALLPAIEARLAPLDARPHWGKLFATPPARLRALYERLPDFRQLLERHDPRGKFRNAFLDGCIFGADE